jgi:xylulose-5-phosphate/fructose-6-phosphate phosphoketolase
MSTDTATGIPARSARPETPWLTRLDAWWRAVTRSRCTRVADRIGHLQDKHTEHHNHIRRTVEDLPEIRDWTWSR